MPTPRENVKEIKRRLDEIYAHSVTCPRHPDRKAGKTETRIVEGRIPHAPVNLDDPADPLDIIKTMKALLEERGFVGPHFDVGKEESTFEATITMSLVDSANQDQAAREALTELLLALPALPENWPPGTVQAALIKALAAYEKYR